MANKISNKSFVIPALTIFIQYYDYHLFGFLAANIAGHFFSSNDIAVQILQTYFIMGLAMMAKPIGSIIFGRIGDSVGRSNSFRISLAGTAIASVIICMTPSYEIIGILSAFILLLCRMVICTLVSSGADGVRLYIYEHIDAKKRSLGVGITTLFTQGGSLAASLSAWYFTLNTMPPQSWRFAFLIGGVFGLIMLLVMKITKFSDIFEIQKVDKFDHFQKMTLKQIIQSDIRLFLLCIMVAGAIGSTTQFIILFFGTYNFEILGIIDRSTMQQFISLAIACYMIFGIIGGIIADKYGIYRVLKYTVFLILIMAVILSFQINSLVFNPWIYLTIACLMPVLTIPAGAIYKRAIPKVFRYRFFSLSHSIGSILFSAPTAFVCTYMYIKTTITWLPILYFIISIFMIFFSIYYLNKREFKD